MLKQFDEFGGTMRDADGREAWEGVPGLIAAHRARNAGHLVSLVVEPGAGHFAWSDRNAAYLALFIRKAAQARIGASGALKSVAPESGWLTDMAIKSRDTFPPAPYADYRGDKAAASWHFDREMAEATAAYHADGFGRKDQFITWNDRYWVDAGARFFFMDLTWVDDGRTLEVHPVYADVYPSQHNGHGPKWALAGKPAGHSSAPIRVRPVSGPIVAVGPNRLRIEFDALNPAGARMRPTFLACSVGDKEYRYTEQVGMMPRGFKGLTKGKAQTVTFPPVSDLKVGGAPVELNATSDAGLPVQYYVACGPAEVVDGKLAVAELPAKARFPIPVKVVACQFGSGVEPLVKTADPVERTLRIVKP